MERTGRLGRTSSAGSARWRAESSTTTTGRNWQIHRPRAWLPRAPLTVMRSLFFRAIYV